MKILVVDDHKDTLDAMAKVIHWSGYDVDTAGDLESARRLCKTYEYPLLIVDVGLPDGSGLDLIKEHRGQVIVLSGYAMRNEIARGLRAGAAEYLLKPIDIDILMKHVSRIMGKVVPPIGAIVEPAAQVKADGAL